MLKRHDQLLKTVMLRFQLFIETCSLDSKLWLYFCAIKNILAHWCVCLMTETLLSKRCAWKLWTIDGSFCLWMEGADISYVNSLVVNWSNFDEVQIWKWTKNRNVCSVKAIWNHDNYSENVQHGILTARGIQNNFF